MRRSRLSAVLAAVIVTASSAWAEPAPGWLSGGRPVVDAGSVQSDPVIAADGAGGVFVVWQDSRSPYLYAQHITAAGEPAPGWPASGLAFTSNPAVDPVIVSDGGGGAFVAASTGHSIDVHHLAADGTVTPASSPGLGVASVEKIQPTVLPVLVPDDEGGAFMAWIQGYWYSSGLKIARITPSGSLVPGWGGALSDYPEKWAPAACSDGAGGVIVAWNAYGATSQDIWATRVNASGVRPSGWADTLVLVCGASGYQKAIGMAPDGAGGAFLVWQDPRNGSYEQVFAQRITSTGAIAEGWPRDGRLVCSLASEAGITRYPGSGDPPASYSSVATDGSGGALIAWTVTAKDGGDIYLQHLRSDGFPAPGWPADGLALCAIPGAQRAPSIVADGTGGAFVTWQDGRSGDGIGAYVQHMTGAGTLAPGWAADGVPVSPAPLDHLIPRPAADGTGGAIVVWQDLRCSGDSPAPRVFVSHVGADGSLPTAPGIPTPWATLASTRADSGTVRLVWNTVGVAGQLATIYCRQVDGPWMAVGTRVPQADGSVVYSDVDAIAGCRYGYGLGLATCGAERIVGQTWVDVPNGAGFSPLSVATHGALADSGVVQLDWQLIAGEALQVTVQRRDTCGSWTTLGTTTTGDEARVTWKDRGLYEDHLLTYRVRVHTCGQDFDLGEFRTVIPRGHGFLPTTATLLHQEAGPGGVYLIWQQQSGPRSNAKVYRRDSTATWTLSATLNPDGAGNIRYFDSTVQPGGHYEYRLGLWSCGAEPLFDPIPIVVPDAPQSHGELALHGASPSPARQELTVLFTLPGSEPASLDLFDVHGRRLLAREVGSLGPGDHALVLTDASTLGSGVYLVRLSQNGVSRSMRVVFMR